MADIFEALAADWRKAENAAARMREHMGINPHHGAPQPAATPISDNEITTTQPITREDHPTMSLASEVEQGYQAVKNEMARFEQGLPAVLEKAKKFEASPFAAVAEKAASAILPAEAVNLAVKAADGIIDDLLSLYAAPDPAAAPAAPEQPVAPAAQ